MNTIGHQYHSVLGLIVVVLSGCIGSGFHPRDAGEEADADVHVDADERVDTDPGDADPDDAGDEDTGPGDADPDDGGSDDGDLGDVEIVDDGDVTDASDAEDGPPPLGALVASPNSFEEHWASLRSNLVFETTITREDGYRLPGLSASSVADWAVVSAPVAIDAYSATITITVDTRDLAAGSHGTAITVYGDDAYSIPAIIDVDIRAVPHYHVGPSPRTCHHTDDFLGDIDTCDYYGDEAIIDAALDMVATGGRILIYADGSSPARYAGPVEVFGDTWISPSAGFTRDDVLVMSTGGESTFMLSGDNIHLQDITILNGCGSQGAVMAWPAYNEPSGATEDHLIEGIVGLAFCPEILGGNSLTEPLRIGPTNTIRNSMFVGYYEGSIDLSEASGARIVNNTFVHYQNTGGLWDVSGGADLVIANNVVAILTRSISTFLTASAGTSGLTLADNYVEGVSSLGEGLDLVWMPGPIEGNVVGEVELESPMNPLPLSDSAQRAGLVVSGEGVSLDGVDLSSVAELRPGAFQLPSTLSLPRRATIRVGSGDCGGSGCDVTASEDNEIQRAVWSAWPGGVVEVYGSGTPYAGNAVISWSITLRGMGASPEDVVLESGEEDELLLDFSLWRHDSVLTVLKDLEDPVLIEELTVIVDADAAADDHAIMLESNVGRPPSRSHELRRLIAETVGVSSGLDSALYLGHDVLSQEVLINGDFNVCVRFGMRYQTYSEANASTSQVVNMTCRLNGSGEHEPDAVFDVASVEDSIFANIAVETSGAAPMFRARRRSLDDTGVTALDTPTSFTAHSVSYRGPTELFDGFADVDGTYVLVDVVEVDAPDPFFVSATDSTLAPGAAAIDSGVDPSTLDPDLSPGTSLNNVDRTGGQIDRGAYEQGL